ncbi:sulfotransferase 1E1-like [Rhopilema esculentum]|uniref:sulfotransferase 1E1-like n=1 Tax=Rhopilema esculentum TaxID=499914 RepID=UPI0031CDB7D9|eukprot:gene6306-11730_t
MAAIEIVTLSEEDTEKLKQVYPNPFVKLGLRFIRVKPSNCVLPSAYEKYKNQFKNWDVRKDDVYVLTFAKNGTTWTQELVWCLQNNCDIEKATGSLLHERVPFLDMAVLSDHVKHLAPVKTVDPLILAENMDSPRVLKSHLPFCHFPDDMLDKCKVVTCLRNPKDTVVSFYFHEKLIKLHDYDGSFETYFDLFMEDLILYTPYFEFVAEAWRRRDHPNLCILFFEDMKEDLASCVRKVAKFLGKDVTEQQVQILVDHLSFKKMRRNRSVNLERFQDGKILDKEGSFLRKGEVGDWKNYFTDAMNKRMEEATDKYLKPIGLEFRYE